MSLPRGIHPTAYDRCITDTLLGTNISTEEEHHGKSFSQPLKVSDIFVAWRVVLFIASFGMLLDTQSEHIGAHRFIAGQV